MKDAQREHLTYPLPPWRHAFRTLSVFCSADGDRVARLLPPQFELRESVLQITVMRFDSTVLERPYYDSAVIAPVRYAGIDGGYWVFGYTSTDQVLSATREIWGFKMKLADRIELNETDDTIRGTTERLGSRIISRLSSSPPASPSQYPTRSRGSSGRCCPRQTGPSCSPIRSFG